MNSKTSVANTLDIAQRIQTLRGLRVVLDSDLAALYGVTTKRLNEQVKRNQGRFPSDFLFQLTADEKAEVVANCDHLKRLKFSASLPYAFTEHGAIQAANVLASKQAVEMGIYVVRAFVQIRQTAALHAEVDKRLRELELKTEMLAQSHESLSKQNQTELRQTRRDLKDVFDTLRELMAPPAAPIQPKRQIGFITDHAQLPKPAVNKTQTLVGNSISLRPICTADFDALHAAAADPLIWEQHPDPLRYEREAFRSKFFDPAVACKMAYVVVDNATGQLIGSSRYYERDDAKREIAIGFTFLARSHWGGSANREMKQLMLDHAFATGFDRVWFHVGKNNMRSRKAMEKISGQFSHEGVKEMGGMKIDYVFFKIDKPAA